MAPTDVTVIIPTLNAAEFLAGQVDTLCSQALPPGRIIVIDSGSTDITASLARGLPVELLTIKPGTFDHGATRNLAAEHARGEIIIFMTQDALPVNNETILRLVEPFLEEEKVIVSYARQIPAQTASPGEKYLRLANYPPQSAVKKKEDIPVMGIKTFQNSNVCAAYRRSEFTALGCFPAPVVCNEDMLFAARAILAGYSVAYSAEALVSHTHNLSLFKQFKRYFDIAASLDHQPDIKAFGKAEEKGVQFVKGQLAYLQQERKLTHLPITLLEIVAKYMGYKSGSKHSYIPDLLKPYMGSNKLYWQNIRK